MDRTHILAALNGKTMAAYSRRTIEALRATYPQPDLDRLLREMLRLYAIETRELTRSVRLPALLAPLRERVAQSLFTIMDDVATRLAAELARTVYRSDRDTRPPDGPAG